MMFAVKSVSELLDSAATRIEGVMAVFGKRTAVYFAEMGFR
jgi:hypothetical protein